MRQQGNTVFTGRTIFQNLPDVSVDGIFSNITVPNVFNKEVLVLNNTATVNITNFSGGAQGQTIKILGDGFTYINNNSQIKTSSGANKLLYPNIIYRYTLINDVWYEDAGHSEFAEEIVSITTGTLTPDVWTAGVVTTRKKSRLFYVSSNKSGAIRLYSTSTLRDDDITANRPRTTVPLPGTVLAEIWLADSNNREQYLSPVPIIYNADVPRDNKIYWAIKQTMLTSVAISFQLVIVPIHLF